MRVTTSGAVKLSFGFTEEDQIEKFAPGSRGNGLDKASAP
jgi:hypothetical protein